MARNYKPIPISEMSEFLKVDSKSKTGLIWTKKKAMANRIKVGDDAGSFDKSTGYYKVKFNGIFYKAHRVVYALFHNFDPGDMLVDHIDFDTKNNKIENLRLLSYTESCRHTRGYGKSKFKGLSWNERLKKWQVRIKLDGESKNLGLIEDEYEAALVAQKAFIERDGFYPWPED